MLVEVDREPVDHACRVALVNLGTAELVSSRLHDYQFNALGDYVADQASVR